MASSAMAHFFLEASATPKAQPSLQVGNKNKI